MWKFLKDDLDFCLHLLDFGLTNIRKCAIVEHWYLCRHPSCMIALSLIFVLLTKKDRWAPPCYFYSLLLESHFAKAAWTRDFWLTRWVGRLWRKVANPSPEGEVCSWEWPDRSRRRRNLGNLRQKPRIESSWRTPGNARRGKLATMISPYVLQVGTDDFLSALRGSMASRTGWETTTKTKNLWTTSKNPSKKRYRRKKPLQSYSDMSILTSHVWCSSKRGHLSIQ